MDIIAALKNPDFNLRISAGNRWAYWDNVDKNWVVMEHKYGARGSTILGVESFEERIVELLTEEE